MDLPTIDDPVGAKLAWAYQHLKELDLQIVRFRNSFRQGEAYEITRELDPQTREEVHRLRLLRHVPLLPWGLLLSEVIHLTRSALDNLIERLTIQNTGSPIAGTSFPVYTLREEFHRVGTRGKNRGRPARGSGLYKTQGLTDHQRTQVEMLQPYQTGSDDTTWRTNALWVINELWNMDKHRTPPVSASGAFTTRMEFTSGLSRDATFMVKFPLVQGAELCRFAPVLGQAEPNMEVKAQIVPEITFEEGPPGYGRPLVPILDKAHIAMSRLVTALDPQTTMEVVATEIT